MVGSKPVFPQLEIELQKAQQKSSVYGGDEDEDEGHADEDDNGPVERNPDADPTWGYYVFVTDYSATAEEHLSSAIENLMRVVQRSLTQFTVPPFSEETFRRFKLDVIQDKGALDGASDDRIREEFRAQIRGQGLVDREGDIKFTPARNMVCLVFKSATIEMLSSLVFPGDNEEDHEVFRQNTVRAIDNCFDHSGSGDMSDYRGVGDCPITSLPRLYMLITSDGNSGAMEDLHPINSESLEL
ncbi:hypothetical protein FQN54_006372 [Arachnomyces sp. PD_36]|nr:hypothetical protein FQN54_006372 [Arachnomyces sp. PD_36]